MDNENNITVTVVESRNKSARVGAFVQLFANGETYTITSRDEKHKNAFYLDGLESSVSRDMFKVL